MTQWHLQPIFDSYALVAVAAAALALLLLIPAFQAIAPRRRGTLLALRLLVILLVLVGMLRPTRVSTTTRQKSATLVMMLDLTRSLEVPDMPAGKTRWQALVESVREAEPILNEIASGKSAQHLELKLYGFDASARPLELTDGHVALPAAPSGSLTDIGSSLDDVLRRERRKRLAGVFLLSDGAQRAYVPRVEMQEAARDLARSGSPLLVVPFGQDIESSRARDVAVENLQDSYTVFVKNELVLRGVLRVRGYVNRPIPVELTAEDAAGKTQVIETRQLTARDDGQQLGIEMTYIPQEAGQYRLTLSAAVQPGELVTKNNELSAFVTVLDGGLKVLYLEGEPQLEQKFLRRAIDSSEDIQLDYVWIEHRQQDRWPVDLGDRLTDAKYDVFMIGDLDARALGEKNLAALAKAVEQGKGLVMRGGFHSFGPGGYLNTPLADVLPILMDRFEKQDFDAPVRSDLHYPGTVQMLPAEEHFITHLATTGDNAAAWRRLEPLQGANKFVGLKDRAKVLAASPEGAPLLVAGEYGLGRVLAFAGDSTWRWWFHHPTEHKRFWRQMILWLARRDGQIRHDVWIDLAQRRFAPQSRVQFVTGVKAASGDDVPGASLAAEAILPDGSKTPVRLAPAAAGITGSFDQTAAPGQYTLVVTARQHGLEIGTARAKFLVLDQDVELSDPSANPHQLEALADITADAGGRRIEPQDLSAALARIKDSPPELEEEVQTRWQLGDTAPDAWTFFLALVGLLTGEWYLRKRWGLV